MLTAFFFLWGIRRLSNQQHFSRCYLSYPSAFTRMSFLSQVLNIYILSLGGKKKLTMQVNKCWCSILQKSLCSWRVSIINTPTTQLFHDHKLLIMSCMPFSEMLSPSLETHRSIKAFTTTTLLVELHPYSQI